MTSKEQYFSNIFGSSLLVVGNTVGAGMLALPIFTGLGGLIPSVGVLILSWSLMLITSFYILEVNLSLPRGASFISMAQKTLGNKGKIISWILWSFLFYTLMTAYIVGGQEVFALLLVELFDYPITIFQAGLIFTTCFGLLIYLGTKAIDYINRGLMIGFFIAYLLLLFMGASYINPNYLLYQHWGYIFFSLPILVLSFGFHNIVPPLAQYFDNRVDLLKRSLIVGSLITFLIYFFFELIILGIIPLEGNLSIQSALNKGHSSTDVLYYIIENSIIGTIGSFFALFAILTSFLATGLSFVHLIQDALKITSKNKIKLIIVVLTVVIPPFLFASVNPNLFLKILNYAGGIGAILIQCILPTLMVWKLRYYLKESQYQIIKGGKVVLILTLILSSFVCVLCFFCFK